MVSIQQNGSSRSENLNGGDSTGTISPEYLMKHPLRDQWTLWYIESDRTKIWEDMLNKVTSFGTVEDFWCLYNNIRLPSLMGENNDYLLFKDTIRPMWEDEANKNGGRWTITFTSSQRKKDLDNMWLETILYMIGATSEYANDINGAVVNRRLRGDKISVWTAHCDNHNAITGIGLELKKYLGTDAKIRYEKHNTINKALMHL